MKTIINNHEWDVSLVKPNDPLLIRDGETLDGRCIPYDRKIVVRNDRTKSFFNQILIHELTHAFFQETDISQPRRSYDSEEVATFNELNAQMIVQEAGRITNIFYKGEK